MNMSPIAALTVQQVIENGQACDACHRVVRDFTIHDDRHKEALVCLAHALADTEGCEGEGSSPSSISIGYYSIGY
jgi:hypothetical protein